MSRVLIVDDNQDVCDVLCDNLSLSGLDIIATSKGGRVLDILKQKPTIKVVVTDMIMPEHSGEHVINDIRSLDKNIRIIAISGGMRSQKNDEYDRLKSMGVDNILFKPVDLDQLEALIRTYLKRK